MKAKEYFQRYAESTGEPLDRLNEILRDITLEGEKVAKARNASKDAAFRVIFNELNQKANKLIQMINEYEKFSNPPVKFRNDCLKIFISNSSPEFYQMIWG